jgi:hypothetical protein
MCLLRQNTVTKIILSYGFRLMGPPNENLILGSDPAVLSSPSFKCPAKKEGVERGTIRTVLTSYTIADIF